MKYNRPLTLSIAGLDPTGGAGLFADIKTFEQLGCLGMGVVTANTIQTENSFSSIQWINKEQIIQQLNFLFSIYSFSFIKIGLIENLDTLFFVCKEIKSKNSSIFIVWDPILSSSSGFNFFSTVNHTELDQSLSFIDLITPNIDEIKKITKLENPFLAAEKLSKKCGVWLKGGHSKEHKGTDYLYWQQHKITLPPTSTHFNEKHGTGCILSSAFIGYLAKGETIHNACLNAKLYLEKVCNTNTHLLAYHYV